MEEIKINAKLLFQFDSFSQWVNKATSYYSLSGVNSEKTIAVDKAGNVCHGGADMMNARDNRLFPVKVYSI